MYQRIRKRYIKKLIQVDYGITQRFKNRLEVSEVNKQQILADKEFGPELVNYPFCILNDGDYVVYDGQHTCVIAATYVENPSEFELPCQVFEHPSEFTLEDA